MQNIKRMVEQNKNNFIFYNISRLREMLRYMSPAQLALFIEIPFLIHINDPEFPAHIPSFKGHPGLWHYENSGMAKELQKNRPEIKKHLCLPSQNPLVQALYHIGSLGTFTQSAKSDFDFWVIIDPSQTDRHQLSAFQEKLQRITTYGKKKFSQEISFFIHTAEKLQKNILDMTDEVMAKPPPFLIKEEFYRTFLMITGKIPLWAILPPGLTDEEKKVFRKYTESCEEYLDLGCPPEPLPHRVIQQGLLWQICKASEDPSKALIKASITASYQGSGQKAALPLLCNEIRQNFNHPHMDDYTKDPYVKAFDRVLTFHGKRGDSASLAEAKVAIFFRLSGFPAVALPEDGSPKRKILNHYVKKWQLTAPRLQKLLNYTLWHEEEKKLLDQAMIRTIVRLYLHSLENEGEKSHDNGDGLILANKARCVMQQDQKNRLPRSSLFLKSLSFPCLGIKMPENPDALWCLCAGTKLLFSDTCLLRVLGWAMANGIYKPGKNTLNMPGGFKIFGSLEKEENCTTIFLALQPWMPISDEVFLKEPVWERIIVALYGSPEKYKAGLLLRNSWGEIFFEALPLAPLDTEEDRCYHLAMKVLEYHGEDSHYFLFHISPEAMPQTIGRIRTLIEDSRSMKKHKAKTPLQRNVRLDII
ncbi:adenylate cyclase class 1 [Desulfobotulus alkaliphilus]|uniref:Adenylate cyclase class 1 n=1 Tax=Desulfobotulus alkaliphilus TaxID=622671 RepID=A0A562RCW6_9BACT|nr:class I adenylate cyclase [Desulfobotulus alkaliphilus]TWI66891.1 adenylate cyclase class 1 [Desulfobotulus alkaliphilus]